MSADSSEIADVIRRYGDAFLARFGHCTSLQQRRVLHDVALCRTASMGGHVEVCTNCGAQRNAYNSCRNRHCPKCLASARFRWTAAREAELLPVPYFHVVFTLPHLLAPLALQNKRVVYNLLFRAAAETLSEVAADSKHLGARVGFLAVLHTWGQTLGHHPHVHCIVPAGGISPDQTQWIHGRATFFLPVRVLSPVFRGKFLDLLYRSYVAGDLTCAGQLTPLQSRLAFKRYLKRAKRQDWVVYCKPPFGGPQQVLRYLARYTHRVAISNSRILSLDSGKVSFLYKDYTDDNQWKTMTLPAVEFVRRFLLHVLPPGFRRIRHYGFMANRDRTDRLNRCRQLIAEAPLHTLPPLVAAPPDAAEHEVAASTKDHFRCPHCGRAQISVLRASPRPFISPQVLYGPVAAWNTS
jgi:predicted RNA-binding Zn-ribbon protein involved in translation (DUF1610 family)